MNIKKIMIVSILVILSVLTVAYADETNIIKVQLNGEIVDFTDKNGDKVDPKIINNRTMVPMRKIFELYDATVGWDEPTQTVTATTKEKQITLQINNEVAKVKDLKSKEEKSISLDQAPLILNNRTMVPVRFISESLEKEVGWDKINNSVIIIDMKEIEKKIADKLSAFQLVLDSNIDSVKSFKMDSTVKGLLEYNNSGESQTVDFNGNIMLLMNESGDVQNDVLINATGSDSTLLNVAKENGYDSMDYSIVVKDKDIYFGTKSGDSYLWSTSQDEIASLYDISSIYNYGKLTNTIVGYIKQIVAEYDTSSYSKIISMVDDLANILTEKSVVVTDSGAVRTVSAKLDLSKLLSYSAENGVENKLVVDINITLRNEKIEGESIKILRNIKMGEESMNLEFNFDSKYSNLNEKIEIKAPSI